MNFLNRKNRKQIYICLYYFILTSFVFSLSGCLSQESGGGSAAGAVSWEEVAQAGWGNHKSVLTGVPVPDQIKKLFPKLFGKTNTFY